MRLSKASEAVRLLEKELDKFNSYNSLREAVGTLTPARAIEGQQLQNRLYEARQWQTSLLLESLNTSSNRLESATTNLQRTSEAQVKVAESQVRVAESHVKVAESQAKAVDDLLKSSHRLEQFAIYLLVMGAVNIFIVEYISKLFEGPYGIVSFVGLLLGITAMTAIAFRWPYWIRRRPRMNA